MLLDYNCKSHKLRKGWFYIENTKCLEVLIVICLLCICSVLMLHSILIWAAMSEFESFQFFVSVVFMQDFFLVFYQCLCPQVQECDSTPLQYEAARSLALLGE